MKALHDAGYEVWGVSPEDGYVDRLRDAGFLHVPVQMSRKGTNPLEDLRLVYRLFRLFKRSDPGLILPYTSKPNIYCSLAARPLGIPVVNTVSGLGALFTTNTALTRVVKQMYRLAFRTSWKVFFQNEDDLSLFVQEGLVDPEIARRVPGSGVDTAHFSPRETARTSNSFSFLFVGRILWDKGIREFVEAARIIRGLGLPVECRVLGFFDPGNPAAVERQEVQAWVDEGSIVYLGDSDDVAVHMADADCVVLPSYREGLPRSLLEAASLAKPLIAADVPGSREVVDHGVNGFLCRPRDARHLAQRMEEMVRLPGEERLRMGTAGREKIEREFDQQIVIEHYLAVAASIFGREVEGVGSGTGIRD